MWTVAFGVALGAVAPARTGGESVLLEGLPPTQAGGADSVNLGAHKRTEVVLSDSEAGTGADTQSAPHLPADSGNSAELTLGPNGKPKVLLVDFLTYHETAEIVVPDTPPR
jgi:hypothetical protein